MFDALKAYFADLTGGAPAPAPEDEVRLATAALMVHLIGIDGTVSGPEQAICRRLLMRHFDLDEAGLAALLAAAQSADREAVDLYRFTAVLKRRLPSEDRQALVEMFWEMVLADGAVHEFEDNTVWRLAELLDVGTRDRVLIRKKVEARLDKSEDDG
ncbi:tellurite resistance TerB family protein [Prosthecodimorpha staleyi]|uniref:TerB family tellurite resistance protein n=1 Tax=Prosthecodimorpha staleyi TaxID=2840188 RepID=A0A947GAT1_9HYPH|nr:TerB family tellurite resistance protein [Prosthecodimorpha staleyi]MBT9289473.1 TerB family tellurite resistance protein [Prosthecodimorpha staleyi]